MNCGQKIAKAVNHAENKGIFAKNWRQIFGGQKSKAEMSVSYCYILAGMFISPRLCHRHRPVAVLEMRLHCGDTNESSLTTETYKKNFTVEISLKKPKFYP
jgi:hypothetical protein